jgi:hypothetical protein
MHDGGVHWGIRVCRTISTRSPPQKVDWRTSECLVVRRAQGWRSALAGTIHAHGPPGRTAPCHSWIAPESADDADLFVGMEKYSHFGHTDSVNTGTYRVFTGGRYDAYLAIPVVLRST